MGFKFKINESGMDSIVFGDVNGRECTMTVGALEGQNNILLDSNIGYFLLDKELAGEIVKILTYWIKTGLLAKPIHIREDINNALKEELEKYYEEKHEKACEDCEIQCREDFRCEPP